MDEVAHKQETGNGPRKRRIGHKKGGKAKTKLKVFQGIQEKKVKINKEMQKLYRKRARDYDSDDDKAPSPICINENNQSYDRNEVFNGKFSEEEEEPQSDDMEGELSEDEDGEIQPGITKFIEGCNAFRMAFRKITKKNVSDDVLGPVLSAHKKLVAEKLAEEETERKVKGDAKKEKFLIGEKGHTKPANFLDSHEKFLIGVATKGVVKLFNAVNKAQNAQKGLNPSRSLDAKVLRKRRKEAFFSELGKPTETLSKASTSRGRTVDVEGPAWAPLRDGYMLTNPKLKSWDKIQDTTVADHVGRDTSSDDD